MTRRSARTCLALYATALLAACSGKADGGPGIVVSVLPSSAALCVGDSVVFSARLLDGAGRELPAEQVVWSSSAPQVATIDPASGVARALALGSTQITASAQGVRSAPSAVDVPADLVPEFVPDTAILAPGDTMTLGVRLRRTSSGSVPSRTPVIAASNSRVARLDATGLVSAKDTGRASLSLSACGFPGHGAVDVFTPPDSVTGWAYLWLSGSAELRSRLPARALNFTRSNGRPGFQIVGPVPWTTRGFLYEDTVALNQPGSYALDSLNSAEITNTLACAPPRPFGMYLDGTQTLLLGVAGGTASVTALVLQPSYTAVSGRIVFPMHGVVGGSFSTMSAIYTFSAPLVLYPGANCH